MSEWLLRCQLVIGVEGLGVERLIIDSTEALQRTWRRCPSLLVSNAASPDIDIVERASGMRGAPCSHLGQQIPREVGRRWVGGSGSEGLTQGCCLHLSCCLPAGQLRARLFPVCPRFLRQSHMPCGCRIATAPPARWVLMAPEVVVRDANSRCAAEATQFNELVRIYTVATSTVNHHHLLITVCPLGRYVPCPSLLLFSRKREKYHGNAISTLPVSLTSTVKCIQSCAY